MHFRLQVDGGAFQVVGVLNVFQVVGGWRYISGFEETAVCFRLHVDSSTFQAMGGRQRFPGCGWMAAHFRLRVDGGAF